MHRHVCLRSRFVEFMRVHHVVLVVYRAPGEHNPGKAQGGDKHDMLAVASRLKDTSRDKGGVVRRSKPPEREIMLHLQKNTPASVTIDREPSCRLMLAMARPACRRFVMKTAILSPVIASSSEFASGSNSRRFMRPIR